MNDDIFGADSFSEELQRRIERRKEIDKKRIPVRVDKITVILVDPKNNNAKYIRHWRKLVRRDRYKLAEKVDEAKGGGEINN